MMVNGVACHWRSLTDSGEWSNMLYADLCVIAW